MTASNYTTEIIVNKTPAEVFAAINNVGGWWQGEITGSSSALNDSFDYRMKDIHFSRQQLVESVPNEKVVWLVTDSNLRAFPNTAEWTGTKISFEISETGNNTAVRFTHNGLVPAMACYKGCSGGWEKLIHESLFSLITTGEGVNVFG